MSEDAPRYGSAPRRPPWPSDPRVDARPLLDDGAATLTLALPLELSLRLAHEAAAMGLSAEDAAVELIDYALRLREIRE